MINEGDVFSALTWNIEWGGDISKLNEYVTLIQGLNVDVICMQGIEGEYHACSFMHDNLFTHNIQRYMARSCGIRVLRILWWLVNVNIYVSTNDMSPFLFSTSLKQRSRNVSFIFAKSQNYHHSAPSALRLKYACPISSISFILRDRSRLK